MAGYTSRNFLSLTIPSILGFLSILWLLKKKSSSSKKISKAIPVENNTVQDCPDKYTLYPMKLKGQEAACGEETVCAEMQLKEAESTPEKQSQISNGVVSQNPKVNGKKENMTRLCENESICLAEEPVSNGCRRDSVPLSNGDSRFKLTNGVQALGVNGAASVRKESFAHVLKRTCTAMGNGVEKNIQNRANGVKKSTQNGANGVKKSTQNGANGVEKSLQNGFKSKSIIEKKENSIASKLDIENEKYGQPEEIKLKTAKNHSDVHKQHLSVCNGITNGESTSAISHSSFTEDKLTSDKLLTLNTDYMVASSNELSSISPAESNVTDIDELNDIANTDEHISQSFVCKPDDTSRPSSSCSHVIDTDKHLTSPVGDVVTNTDAENAISPINVVTDANNLVLSINIVTDTGHLSSPVDYVVADSADYAIADAGGEMLESPGAKYCDSLGSNDSGRGSYNTSEADGHLQVHMVYEFEILSGDCGRLIGKKGGQVTFINKQTNARIFIKRHPCFTDRKICSVTGTETEINAALKLIRKRFPVEQFPSVTLAQTNAIPIHLLPPDIQMLSLPERVFFDALLCSTITAGHFFLQQPNHPTYYQLPPLTNAMTALYSQNKSPLLENPVEGNVCVAEVGNSWYRAEVIEVFEQNCRLKYLDYGGYSDVPKTSLRQIKGDYLQFPIQATECYLAGVMPLDENGWSIEATLAFEQLLQGQLIQGCIINYAGNVPCVNLYKTAGGTTTFINQHLIDAGLARAQ